LQLDQRLRDVALLLTVHNAAEKTPLYSSVIEYYLENYTTFRPVFVVDSSNNGFAELESRYGTERLRVLKYNQTAEVTRRVQNRGSKDEQWLDSHHEVGPSTYEKIELDAALDEFAHPFASRRFVVKLTGKYRLPELASALLAIPINTTLAIQHSSQMSDELSPGDQWCSLACSEMFAMPADVLARFLASFPDTLEKSMENYLSDFVEGELRTNAKVHRLQALDIPREYRVPRSNGSVKTVL